MATVELLSPAKNLEVGLAAIRNGADAVYIGAPAFGARKAASNSLRDIETLTKEAHKFFCRVFVTLNTVLFDDELPDAERLIWDLYKIGVDALLVQDMAVLRMKLPPIALHASTQTHNYDLERIKFLDRVGFSRIVLARELSIEEIKTIRKEIKAEIEVFVHGALCVSLSGQCYLSEYMFGRSANRGECAQPCRQRWTLKDDDGTVIVKDKHLLSLKDMNRSAHLKELVDAGVTSFKIEGRLKDIDYVSNVTRYYSEALDKIEGVKRVGSGRSEVNFIPDPERSFNRGFTDYFAVGRNTVLTNRVTPKSMGKFIGTVEKTSGNVIYINGNTEIHNGDGLCYVEGGELCGVRVNKAEGKRITCHAPISIKSDTPLYRNYDHLYTQQLERNDSVRKIDVAFVVSTEGGHVKVSATDKDGICVDYVSAEVFDVAQNANQADRLCQQMAKCGESEFNCTRVSFSSDEVLFVPAANANMIRRETLLKLQEEREKLRPRLLQEKIDVNLKYPLENASWQCNVTNNSAEQFYMEHGCKSVERGFEQTGGRQDGRAVMTTRFCLLYESGLCLKRNGAEGYKRPFHLCNGKEDFELQFDCARCEMKILNRN